MDLSDDISNLFTVELQTSRTEKLKLNLTLNRSDTYHPEQNMNDHERFARLSFIRVLSKKIDYTN